MLSLKLPFSDELYSEEMIDLPALDKQMKTIDYELIEEKCFADEVLTGDKYISKMRE